MRKSELTREKQRLLWEDIPEAGELAVEHFRFMEGATDAKPQYKLNSRLSMARYLRDFLTGKVGKNQLLPANIGTGQTARCGQGNGLSH